MADSTPDAPLPTLPTAAALTTEAQPSPAGLPTALPGLPGLAGDTAGATAAATARPSTASLPAALSEKAHSSAAMLEASESSVAGAPSEVTSLFSPRLADKRKLFFILGPVVIAFLCLVFWVMLAIFFGSIYNPLDNIARLNILLVDQDGGAIGTALQAFTAYFPTVAGADLPTFVWSGPSGNVSTDAIVATLNGGDTDVFGAIVLNPGSSATLQAALTPPVNVSAPTYNPRAVFTVLAVEGRNPLPVTSVIEGSASAFLAAFGAVFGTQHAARFASTMLGLPSAAVNATMAAAVHNPAALGSPIGFTLDARYPFNGNSVTAFIFVFVLSIFGAVGSVLLTDPFKDRVYPHHLLLMRLGFIFTYSFFLSLVVAVNVAIFGATFYSNWFFYWMVVLITVCAIAFTEQFLFVATPPPVFLAFSMWFLILNVASGDIFNFVQLSSPFYDVGYGMIFFNCVQASRFVFFGSFNMLYRNLPILFAYSVSSILLTTLVSLRRQPTPEAANRAAAAAFCADVAMSTLSAIRAAEVPTRKLPTLAVFVRAFALFGQGHLMDEHEFILASALTHGPSATRPAVEAMAARYEHLFTAFERLLALCASPNNFGAGGQVEQVQSIIAELSAALAERYATLDRILDVDFYTAHYKTKHLLRLRKRLQHHIRAAGDQSLLYPFFAYSLGPEDRPGLKASMFGPARTFLFGGWARSNEQVWHDWAPFVSERL